MITRSQFRSLLARLVDNLGWKIVSLLLSIGLWIVIRIAVVEEYEASQENRGPMAIRQIRMFLSSSRLPPPIPTVM